MLAENVERYENAEHDPNGYSINEPCGIGGAALD
jgi:hypothetical protein